jgi:SAM-dependent methyltransferase
MRGWPWKAVLASDLEEPAAGAYLAACGSGGHALALAKWGYAAAGVDASPVMIEMARRKAVEAGLDIPFAVADLGRFNSLTAAEARQDEVARVLRLAPYDAVLCLGNSLPHLLTQVDLIAALAGMGAMLKAGGLLVLQNLNYDLRWQKQPRWFAAQGGELDGQEVLVWRFADYDVLDRISFHIVPFKREGGWQVESTPRLIVRCFADLFAALEEEVRTLMSASEWLAGAYDQAHPRPGCGQRFEPSPRRSAHHGSSFRRSPRPAQVERQRTSRIGVPAIFHDSFIQVKQLPQVIAPLRRDRLHPQLRPG